MHFTFDKLNSSQTIIKNNETYIQNIPFPNKSLGFFSFKNIQEKEKLQINPAENNKENYFFIIQQKNENNNEVRNKKNIKQNKETEIHYEINKNEKISSNSNQHIDNKQIVKSSVNFHYRTNSSLLNFINSEKEKILKQREQRFQDSNNVIQKEVNKVIFLFMIKIYY